MNLSWAVINTAILADILVVIRYDIAHIYWQLEGSHSGLVRCLGKAVSGQPDREFESPTLREEQSDDAEGGA